MRSTQITATSPRNTRTTNSSAHRQEGTTLTPSETPPHVAHYENFPVASMLCPPALRPCIAAIYHFARTADDIADEGDGSAEQRLTELAAYRAHLEATLSATPHTSPWNGVFHALSQAIQSHHLPAQPLRDLLSAFEQDVRVTASGYRYADETELLAYCRLSANPVGRLLLHLYKIDDPVSLQQSDALCSALQLINFWQDLSVDLPRGRVYLPAQTLAAHGLQPSDFKPDHQAGSQTQACQACVETLCNSARSLMALGAPLVHRVPGRAGWELRLVVQGGLRILDRIAALDHRSWQTRPKIGKADLPWLLWRALRMR